MTKSPNPGNLRDFRIDYGESPQDSVTQVPRQDVRARASAQDLWQEWSNGDAGAEVDLSRPAKKASTPNPTVARPEKAAEATTPLRTESTKQIPWATELAFEERRMEAQGVVDFTSVYQKQEVLKIRTREYLLTLQDAFRTHVELFNESRRSPSHAIHIYKVSNSEGDFMLFRNGVKLVVSGQRAGRVIFAFNQYLGQIFAPSQAPMIELEANWGPFDQLFWSYKGERIQLLDVVRYFVTEFARQSYK